MQRLALLAVVLIGCAGSPADHVDVGPVDDCGEGGAQSAHPPAQHGGEPSSSTAGQPAVGGASDGGTEAGGATGGQPEASAGAAGSGGEGGAQACVSSIGYPLTFDELCGSVGVDGYEITIGRAWAEGSTYCLGDQVVGVLPGEARCQTAIFTCWDEAGCSSYGPDSDDNLASYGDLPSWQAGTWRTQYLSPDQALVQCTGQGIGACSLCDPEGC